MLLRLIVVSLFSLTPGDNTLFCVFLFLSFFFCVLIESCDIRASPSEFVIPLSKYAKAVYHTRVSVGMRFRMLFETEESSVRRYISVVEHLI